jgi:hypothetical protein
VVLDLQEGLFSLARDENPSTYRQAIFAHAELGQLFDLPVILSTSSDQGPNGPLPGEIIDMYPTAPFIRRQGEVNAWDNADFREAVISANKSQIIIGGIVTDVCKLIYFILPPPIFLPFPPPLLTLPTRPFLPNPFPERSRQGNEKHD